MDKCRAALILSAYLNLTIQEGAYQLPMNQDLGPRTRSIRGPYS